MASSKVSLKLLIDKKSQRVLFAEAGKDFVDFLFTLLALPIGTVIRLLTKKAMVGCLANLYESIENLNDEFLQRNQKKDVLLKPKSSLLHFSPQVPLLPFTESSASSPAMVPITLYKCSHCINSDILSTSNSKNCWVCGSYSMSAKITHYVPEKAQAQAPAPGKATGGDERGFVKGMVTYMVMDDLVVTPMSTISSITLLNKFNIKEVGVLEEKVVEVGMDEGLLLLKNALSSKAVLTNVFLGQVGEDQAK